MIDFGSLKLCLSCMGAAMKPVSQCDIKQEVTEAWSCNHLQPEMGFLGSAGRQYTKINYLALMVIFFMFS